MRCTPTADRAPGTAAYVQHADGAALDAAFDASVAAAVIGECPGGQSSWSRAGSSGRLACGNDATGISNVVIWTDTSLRILGYAETALLEPSELFSWWQGDSGPN